MTAQSVEDLQGIGTQFHLREAVVVFGNLGRVGHTHEQLKSDVWVIYHDVWESLRGHADMENQFWIYF